MTKKEVFSKKIIKLNFVNTKIGMFSIAYSKRWKKRFAQCKPKCSLALGEMIFLWFVSFYQHLKEDE